MEERQKRDQDDLAEAARLMEAGGDMIRAGRKLRQRVNTRIRTRRWAAAKKEREA